MQAVAPARRRMVLEGPLFGEYFRQVEVSNFEVASDAFQTFKDLLTRHKGPVAAYLQSHYDEVRGPLAGQHIVHCSYGAEEPAALHFSARGPLPAAACMPLPRRLVACACMELGRRAEGLHLSAPRSSSART